MYITYAASVVVARHIPLCVCKYNLSISIIDCTLVTQAHLTQSFNSVRSMIIVVLLPLSTFLFSIITVAYRF